MKPGKEFSLVLGNPDAKYLAKLSVAYRDAGTNLAEAASRVIGSITNDRVDGIHRLALAVARWYQTLADERP